MSNLTQQLQEKQQAVSSAFKKLPPVLAFEHWFLEQNERDRSIIKATGAFITGCLIIVLFVQPFYSKQAIYQAQLKKSISTYEQLASNAHKFTTNRTSSSSSTPILALITQQAKLANINLKRFEPDDDNLRIWLDNESFDSAVRWLETLTQDHGVQVKQISIDRSDKPGRVDLRATLYK